MKAKAPPHPPLPLFVAGREGRKLCNMEKVHGKQEDEDEDKEGEDDDEEDEEYENSPPLAQCRQ